MATFFTPLNLIENVVVIDLIGAGGTGSEVFDGLARMHMALTALGHPGLHVRLWDNDDVSATNILRQRFLPGEVGANKAEVLVQKYNVFFGLSWEAIPCLMTPAHIAKRADVDLIITCVDKAQVRVDLHCELNDRFIRNDLLWLDTGNGASDGQVILGHLGKYHSRTLKLPNVLDLYPEMAEAAATLDNDGPSCSAEEALSRQEFPVNRMVAVAAYSLLWNLLRHGKTDHHGVFINTLTGSTSPLKIDEAAWMGFGYAA